MNTSDNSTDMRGQCSCGTLQHKSDCLMLCLRADSSTSAAHQMMKLTCRARVGQQHTAAAHSSSTQQHSSSTQQHTATAHCRTQQHTVEHSSTQENSHREQVDGHGDTMCVQNWGKPAVFHTAATTCLFWKQYQHQRKALMSLPLQSQSSGLRAYNTGKAVLWRVGSRGREAPLRPSRTKQSAITYGFRADGALSHCQ